MIPHTSQATPGRRDRATGPHPRRSNLPLMIRALALVVVTYALAACTASAADSTPPNDPYDPNPSDPTKYHPAELFWPTALAITPDESRLFVANANSDLAYNTGTVDVIDLDLVEAAVTPWAMAPATRQLAAGCTQDTDFTETMICDATPYIKTEAGVRIGNFATAISVQNKGGSPADLRLIVPVRGDPSITWIDWSGADQKLVCDASSAGGFPQCDDVHRLTHIRNDATLPPLPDEPFDAFVDSGNDYALVTHLTSGSVSLIDTPKDGTPMITDAVGGLFGANSLTGVLGASAVAGRDPGSPEDIVYVGSRSEGRIQTMSVIRPRTGPALLEVGNFFFLDAVGGQSGGSSDSRGIAFGSGGDRMYLINRQPPTLQIYDTSIGPDGTPQNIGLGATDICRTASRLVLADPGDGERVYIACFDDGQIYVIDPRNGGQLEDVITVGRGPYDVVASPSKHRLYVTDYLENSVAVIDLTPGALTHDRVVMRIGKPKAP